MIPETQLDAFRQLKNANEKRSLVFRAIDSYGSLTLFELVKILQWPVNRISGRVRELSKQGKIKDSGLRRINPESGKSGIVWVVK